MKKIICILMACFLMGSLIEVRAQVVDPEKVVKKKGATRTNKKVDEGVDKGLDKLEKGIGSLFGKKKKKKKEEVSTDSVSATTSQGGQSLQQGKVGGESQTKGPSLTWAKYDFVPGDKVIFEDNLLDEENGEFPSRWDLFRGNVEIAEFGGENVIMFMSGRSCIVPYLKNSGQDYLPDIFTIELDAYYDVEPHSAKYYVALYDKKAQKGTGSIFKEIQLFPGGIQYDATKNLVSDGDGLWYNRTKPFWRHIAIGFNVRSLKVYYDDVRMLNIPNLGFNPTGLSIEIINTDPVNFYINNIRIAEGGQKLYDKFMQDGKIVSNGIRFDVGKATLKPESMGIINEIADLMKEHSEVSFSVEGHTDSDGDDALNQTLSEQRAGTVVNTLKKLGIDGDRMTSKGWGESKPLDSNASPEGKANNRRVEFVKK